LNNEISLDDFDSERLNTFSKLDDYDIISAMKTWQYHDDFVLKNLCEMIINRSLLKIKIKKNKIKKEQLEKHKALLIEEYHISEAEADYFVFSDTITNQAYQDKKQIIRILHKNGKIQDIVKASDQLNLKALSKPVTKYFICFPKQKL
jgi:hypothetical protein